MEILSYLDEYCKSKKNKNRGPGHIAAPVPLSCEQITSVGVCKDFPNTSHRAAC